MFLLSLLVLALWSPPILAGLFELELTRGVRVGDLCALRPLSPPLPFSLGFLPSLGFLSFLDFLPLALLLSELLPRSRLGMGTLGPVARLRLGSSPREREQHNPQLLEP